MVAVAAVVGGAATLGGAYLSSSAAKSAAKTGAAASDKAANLAQDNYGQIREDLAPYRAYGGTAGNALMQQMPQLTSQYDKTFAAPTLEQLQATPGYQFTLQQGLQGVQNSASARGLGVSGAALKGAADYATGLAQNTYQNVFRNNLDTYNTGFNVDQANKTNAYNKLLGITNIGASAANQTGGYGTTAATNAGNQLVGGAQAQAAGTVGSANAISSGLTNSSNNFMNAYLANKLIDSRAATPAAKGSFL